VKIGGRWQVGTLWGNLGLVSVSLLLPSPNGLLKIKKTKTTEIVCRFGI